MLRADPQGILALAAVAMCWSLAVVLFRAGARGSVARQLALLLAVEGVAVVSCGASQAGGPGGGVSRQSGTHAVSRPNRQLQEPFTPISR